ncbi:hypothetical protein [Streptomyces spectabilis]|uniref:Uncharacterized protein n=1 Tax=Streptomyces spectabilis TaxID=68270 RepID=A0A5P2WZI4_STRST|nr:hypothetical protein [Streptomyces spectabilis]MBB5108847.1 hypothetical protein [Streptomyces spectabilis]MCI3899851.1 hypothetical protein [Streptomyces spectabilis]QEV57508.1 hypothetical protein CP982_01170 [Streptomyces spectabilis]GGV42480.1 hypothetical protein GCM10010245_66640 [Streptomyces spectabilis]
MTANDITLHVDRDRVHAGDDDVPPHRIIAATLSLGGDITIGEAVDAITRGPDRYFLASVVGGATWVLYGGPGIEKPYADRAVALAVIAEGSDRPGGPRLVVDPDLPLSRLADADGSVSFHFDYLRSADPQETWQRLRAA